MPKIGRNGEATELFGAEKGAMDAGSCSDRRLGPRLSSSLRSRASLHAIDALLGQQRTPSPSLSGNASSVSCSERDRREGGRATDAGVSVCRVWRQPGCEPRQRRTLSAARVRSGPRLSRDRRWGGFSSDASDAGSRPLDFE
jgi:hypothetical protein